MAYDFDGELAWGAQVSEDPGTHRFGSGSSLLLYANLVIVPASVECEAILAFDAASGREVWRAPAEGYGAWWSTPILAKVGDRTELIVSVPDEVWGLNPDNGKLRWYSECDSDRALSPSVVLQNDVVYAMGGSRGWSMAVRTGGRGDVSKSHVVWTSRQGSYVPSPVVVGDHLYWGDDRGHARCSSTKTGELGYRERLPYPGPVYASALGADGKIYAVTRHKGTFVLAAKTSFEVLSHNVFESDESDFNASPAVSNGRLLLRSDQALYCIGRPRKTKSF